jgi:hypothetical protein
MAKRRSREGPCSVDGCESPIVALGLCNLHYKAAKRHGGDPLGRHTVGRCYAEGCDQLATTKGLCGRHYKLWTRHGDPNYVRPVAICTVPGCDKPAESKGMCNPHYKKQARHGDPLYVRPPAPRPPTKKPVLPAEAIAFIQEHRDIPASDLATRFRTTIRTVIAVQAGRGWGFVNE